MWSCRWRYGLAAFNFPHENIPMCKSQPSKAGSPDWGGLDSGYLLGFEVCKDLMLYIPCLLSQAEAVLLRSSQIDPGMGTATELRERLIVLEAESSSAVAAGGLGADSGSRAGRKGGSPLLPPGILEGAIPQLLRPQGSPAGAKLTGKGQMQESLEKEPELQVIRASSKKREIPISPGRTSDAQSSKTRTGTYALRTGMDDGGKVSLFSLSRCHNLPAEQLSARKRLPVTRFSIYHF